MGPWEPSTLRVNAAAERLWGPRSRVDLGGGAYKRKRRKNTHLWTWQDYTRISELRVCSNLTLR